METAFSIPGKPFGKQRPKFSRVGRYVKTFTPDKTVSYENLVKFAYIGACKGHFPDNALLEVSIFAYYQIPTGTSKSKRARMIEHDIRPGKKPDADNIAKVICDALNGLAYKDDNAIAVLRVEKFYSENPRVDVIIRELNEENG